MNKMMMMVLAVAGSIFATGCGKDSPTSPSPSREELAQTPSAQAPVISINIVKEPQPTVAGQMRVTLGENPNRGLPDDRSINDWNGAKIRMIMRCDGRETFRNKDLQSGDVDLATNKSILVFTQVNTCNGNSDFRLQAFAPGESTPRDFTFPRGALFTTTGYNIAKDADNGHSYIRGTVR